MTPGVLSQRVCLLLLVMLIARSAGAQDQGKSSPGVDQQSNADSKYGLDPGDDPDNHLIIPFMKHIGSDQKEFWTYPAHLKIKDLKWIAPTVGITAGLIASDSWISKQIPNKPNQLSRSLNVSDYSLYSLIGIGGGSYLLGEMTHNDHLSETGLLSGEAAIDATGVAYILKGITQRERPNAGTGDGKFFQGGQSFPSEHSTIAWSIASVWAHEYPSTLSQILAYGLASTVTLTRVTSQQHFSSDVFIGGALGWYFGRQVYRSHHDQTLGGAAWGDLFPKDDSEKTRDPNNMGSPYVTVDSWVYPAFERLAALGYIHSGYLGMRPWTRMECARLLEEAEDRLADDSDKEDAQAGRLYEALQAEFGAETARLDGAENLGASLDSVYTRSTEISGKPLTDGYHFGQTIVDDYGRPYGEGFNNVTGFTSHAVAGPFAISVQGEYQHAPAIPSESPNVLQAAASADGLCPQAQAGPGCSATVPVSELINGVSGKNRFDLLEATVSLTVHNVQFSLGKQSQWMGPGESGSLLFSNNAEPVLMFKVDAVTPYRVPLLSKLLGPMRSEYFIGQTANQRWEFNSPNLIGPGHINPQPFLDGYKASFKPTENLEIGMGVTAQFGGPGLPVTLSNFFRTFYSHNSTGSTSGNENPGKRISAADFTYRIPGMRNWVTFYADSMVVDEVSPFGSSRATVNPGFYFPQIPGVSKLELRLEGINEPRTNEFSPGFVYFGLRRYRSGYTNDGMLMGSWIGRAGRGGQGWLTYSFTPRTRLQAGYRLQEVSPHFIGGGRDVDYTVDGNFRLSRNASIATYLQYERWWFPVLSTMHQSDFTARVQITFYPQWKLR